MSNDKYQPVAQAENIANKQKVINIMQQMITTIHPCFSPVNVFIKGQG